MGTFGGGVLNRNNSKRGLGDSSAAPGMGTGLTFSSFGSPAVAPNGGAPVPGPGPGGKTFGSSPFPVYTGTTNPTGGGPIAMNPGNAMAKPGNTGDKNLQMVMANRYNQDIGTQGGLLNENERALDFSHLTDSPLYKQNLEIGRSAIGTSYEQAMANTRRNSIGSGFGYANPVAQGADAAVRGEAASALSKAPGEALKATIDPTLKAASIRSGEMGQFNPDPVMAQWEDLVKGKSGSNAQMMSGLMQAIGTLGSSAMTNFG